VILLVPEEGLSYQRGVWITAIASPQCWRGGDQMCLVASAPEVTRSMEPSRIQ